MGITVNILAAFFCRKTNMQYLIAKWCWAGYLLAGPAFWCRFPCFRRKSIESSFYLECHDQAKVLTYPGTFILISTVLDVRFLVWNTPFWVKFALWSKQAPWDQGLKMNHSLLVCILVFDRAPQKCLKSKNGADDSVEKQTSLFQLFIMLIMFSLEGLFNLPVIVLSVNRKDHCSSPREPGLALDRNISAVSPQ